MAELTPERSAQILSADSAFRAGKLPMDSYLKTLDVQAGEAPDPLRAGRIPSGKQPSLISKVGDAIGDLYSAPFGLSDEQLGTLINQSPEDYKGPMGLVRTFNRAIVQGGSVAGDFTVRTLSLPFSATAAAVGITAEELGMDPAESRRLMRDIHAGVQLAAAALGGRTLDMKALMALSKSHTDNVLATQRFALDSAEGKALQRAARIAEDTAQKQIGHTELQIPRPMSLQGEPGLDPQVRRRVIAAFEQSGVRLNPDEMISDQILRSIRAGDVDEDVMSLLVKNGVNLEDLGRVFRADVTASARNLGELSVAARRMQRAAEKASAGSGDDLANILKEASRRPREEVRAMNWWYRADNLRRGLMVSQPATAARNAIVATGRVGLDTMNDVIDLALTAPFRMAGKAGPQTKPLDAFGDTARFLFSRGTKKQVDDLMKAFPDEMHPLFARYSADIAPVKGAPEHAVELLNVFNRAQDFMFRRVKFASVIDTELRKTGTTLDAVIKGNRTDLLSTDLIKKGVSDALDFTFSAKPNGEMGKAFVNVVNKVGPPLTYVLPFPRFMVNSMKFLGEYNPGAALKLLSSAERAKLAAGDTATLTKSLTGGAMLLAAHQLRSSEYAGEAWYQIKVGDKTIDARPYFPFSAYLYAADVIKRYQTGTLFNIGLRDIAEGALGVQGRVDTGILALDELIQGLADVEPTEKGLRKVSQVIASGVSGFMVPLQTLSDVIGEFDREERINRERNAVEGPVSLTPITASIPVVKQSLPEKKFPTREGTRERQATGLRQITGITILDPDNELEKEINRLQFKSIEVLPKTGIPTYDTTVAEKMGQISQNTVLPIVESDGYKNLAPKERSVILRRLLGKARVTARKMASESLIKDGREDVMMRVLIDAKSRRDQMLLRELLAQ